ncbi:MAG: ATP-dependent DNA helicase [Patescibacteria group bacterium]|nr:ATP-dependent helicase [Patescibacteria group bacterium]MBU2508995.1 ATP-dependent helicase [Patescibacteria group bacterium]
MSTILEGLNEAQLKAVTHDKGPLLIVAGAGTGKTTVLTRRYAWLMQDKGWSTDNILALTFTEKASEEMEERVLQLISNGSYDFWISTFHGFCQRVLEKHALEIGLPNNFRILNETDAWLLLKRRLDDLPLDHYRPLGNPVKFLSALFKHISRAKDEGVTAEQYLEFAENVALNGDTEFVTGERKRLKELADCYFAYRKILREEGYLDFGDLIIEALRLFRERPAILQQYQQQFKTIMVDEFQDTNWAQYELVKLLAGSDKNLTVVGDDDQAIYKFRGASLANILQFRDDFPESVTVALNQNYRSKQEVLDVSYGLIKHNDPYRLEVKLADTGLSKALSAVLGTGGDISANWYQTLEKEAESVVQQIKDLKQDYSDLSWNDFAILVRSNQGAMPFIGELERVSVPYQFYALRGLYSKSLIVDLITLLNLSISVHDSAYVWRAMNIKCFGFSALDVSEFIQFANRKSLSLWQALKRPSTLPGIQSDVVQKVESFVAKVEALSELAKSEVPLKFLQSVLHETGLLAHILKQSEGEKIEQINFLNTFANRIKRYEATTNAPCLREFLEELKMEIDSGEQGVLDFDPDIGPEVVKVMTVHAAKGLEFAHVFVVSLVDQRFPTRERADAIPLPDGLVNEQLPEGNTHLEEERRLMYVAMTRAKQSLTLTGATNYGGTRKKKPSLFLDQSGVEMKEDTSPMAGGLTGIGGEEQKKSDAGQQTPDDTKFYPLKRRFSFTQLAAFRSCPTQYKFAHVYRIPILGSHHRSFGQAVHLSLHDILQFHIDRGKAKQADLFGQSSDAGPRTSDRLRVSLDEALEIYEQRWAQNDQWYSDKITYDKYKKEGRQSIKHMWGSWDAMPPDVMALEKSFNWKVGEHSLRGSVDRIDNLSSGGVAIYDYKTGEPKSADKLKPEDKEQLRIYQLAMENQGMRVEKLAYVYARSGQEAEVSLLDGEKKDRFQEDIQERMQAILVSNFPPSPSEFKCQYCDFRNVCEFRKL